MTETIQQLITDRKARLIYFIFGQCKARLEGKRGKLVDVSEANEDNEETDRQLLEMFDYLPY